MTRRQPGLDTYRVACVCAHVEAHDALAKMLDEEHQRLTPCSYDTNRCTLGRIGQHNIVITLFQTYRRTRHYTVNQASTETKDLFPNLQIILLVGTCSGVPPAARLGDVFLGTEIIELGTESTVSPQEEMPRPADVLNELQILSSATLKDIIDDKEAFAERAIERLCKEAKKDPSLWHRWLLFSSHEDILFAANPVHKSNSVSCQDWDRSKIIPRDKRSMKIHTGTIASRSPVSKGARFQDDSVKMLGSNIICIDTECISLIAGFTCIVIRGIADYADPSCDNKWIHGAAAAAAACASEFLRMVSTSIADKTKQQPSDDGAVAQFRPSPEDIMNMRAILNKLLPPEITIIVLDMAEYWGHSSNEFDYGEEGLSITGSDFLLRSYPVGLRDIYGDKKLIEELTYHNMRSKLRPLGKEYNPGFFAGLSGYPTPKHPVRKVVFTVKSHHKHPRKSAHLFTWFEAGLERFDAEQTCDTQCTYDVRFKSRTTTAPLLPMCGLRPLYPELEPSKDTKNSYRYNFSTAPNNEWTIQRNRMTNRNTMEHIVTWSYLDQTEADSAEAQELENEGRGRATGDGSFVRSLKLGDVVTIWGKTEYAQSMNVERVKVDVYWAI